MAETRATKRVCIDVGGTFTDCLVMEENGRLEKFKASTTPSNRTQGFMDAKAAHGRYSLGGRSFDIEATMQMIHPLDP